MMYCTLRGSAAKFIPVWQIIAKAAYLKLFSKIYGDMGLVCHAIGVSLINKASFLTLFNMYNYEIEKSKLFTEDGQVKFLKVRDNVQHLLKISGAVMMEKAISVITSDTWFQLACVDRLVELEELKEITNSNVAGQFRVFISPNNRL